jgi:hypothetical protein
MFAHDIKKRFLLQIVFISEVGWSFWTPPTNIFLIKISVVNLQNRYVACLGMVVLAKTCLGAKKTEKRQKAAQGMFWVGQNIPRRVPTNITYY